MDFLADPFSAEFIQSGAVAAAIVGVVCGVVGCFVVLRGLALVADSLAHGVVPGVAVAFLLAAGGAGAAAPSDAAITAGALIAGLLTAAATGFILSRGRVREETAAAVVFVFMLALGVALISSVEGYTVDLTSFLFGDVLAAGWGDAAAAAVAAVAILALVAVLYRPFVLLSFDRRRAATLGVAVDRTHLAMLAVITLAVVVGFRVVGALLVLGMLIAPPATAALLTRRLPAMMALSAAIAAASAPLGLLASWHLDIAAGPAIVLVAVAPFPVALLARGPAPA